MNGIEAIAAILKTEGVDWLACYPSNPLIEAAAQVGVRPINFRHERGAVMAADGYSRTSGRQRFGVVAVQSQAGAENAMGGIAQAYADNVPILVLPGGVNLDQLAVKPNFSASNNYQGVVKRVEAIYRPDQVSSVMRRAFHALRNGPPGPVVVEMLTDVCDQEVPPGSFDYRPPQMMKQVPAQAEIDEAVKELLRAEKPVIWAGGGVLLAGATAALRELAELTGIPVFCTMPGKSALDERHPLCLGAGSRATTLPAHRWLQECDLLLAIGSSLTRGPYSQIILPGKVIIQNSIDADDINKDESVDIGLVGDAKLTLEAMIESVRREVGDGRACEGTSDSCRDRRLQETVAGRMDAFTDLGRRASQHVPCDPRYRPHPRLGEQHRHPRRRRTARLNRSLLHCHLAQQLHRLGQDDAPRLSASH